MLITSIFSFSHNVFKGLHSEGYQILKLCCKELKYIVVNGGNAANLLLYPFSTMFSTNKFCHLSHNELFTKRPISDRVKLKVFADNKINVAEMMISRSNRVENIVGKRRKCWLPAFSPFPTMFSKILLFQSR